MSDDPWSDWHTVPELAPKLGMSQATLKRRLTLWSRTGERMLLPNGRGAEVQAEKVARPQGDEWRARVRLSALAQMADQSADQDKPDSKATPSLTSAQGDAQGFLRLVEIERAERQKIAAENDTLRERAVRAETLADAQIQTISALSAALAAQEARAADLAQRLADAERDRDAERAEVRRLLARPWWKLW